MLTIILLFFLLINSIVIMVELFLLIRGNKNEEREFLIRDIDNQLIKINDKLLKK